MRRRTFEEMIAYFDQTVSGMDIDPKYKITLLGIATALLQKHDEDLTEIVRCKDCKHQVKEWRTDKRLKDNGYMVCGCDVVGDACGYWALLGQDDDFCSYAERRTDDADANS